MTTSENKVTGTTCGYCEMSIRGEVRRVAGSHPIDVTAKTGRLVVTGNDELDAGGIVTASHEACYGAVRVP